MATLTRKLCCSFVNLTLRGINSQFKIPSRCIYPNSNTTTHEVVERHRKSQLSQQPEIVEEQEDFVEVPRDFKFVSPEYLPNPKWEYRDRIQEKLEREDMYRRREVVDIPEFYVGSILAVTVTDPCAPGKQNRFVGICISRRNHGLRANFIVRNVIDGQGLEVQYCLYSPLVQKIEVLKLEKRLDDELLYLRDCPHEYSTVPFDMEPTPNSSGNYVPLNTIKVPLNPKPWLERWERKELKGVTEIVLKLSKKQKRKAEVNRKDYEKYDLMKHYRESINDVEKSHIYREVQQREQKIKELKDKKKSIR